MDINNGLSTPYVHTDSYAPSKLKLWRYGTIPGFDPCDAAVSRHHLATLTSFTSGDGSDRVKNVSA